MDGNILYRKNTLKLRFNVFFYDKLQIIYFRSFKKINVIMTRQINSEMSNPIKNERLNPNCL